MIEVPWYIRVGLAFVMEAMLAATLVLSYITDDPGTRNLVVGAILGYVAAINQYFFGSSEGSRSKDLTIAKQSDALATSIPGEAHHERREEQH